MYSWRRLASKRWWIENGKELRRIAKNRLTLIERPNRKLLLLEVAFESESKIKRLRKKFGGQSKELPRGWLKQFLTPRGSNPSTIGKRLIVYQSPPGRNANSFPRRLIIPAGAAFGTGAHATTTLSLRLLEEVTYGWKADWKMVDLGTGSGILALAASRFGAKQVIGIDLDPIAISTAKANAHL